MTTLSITDLEELLGRLGIDIPIPHFEAADLLDNPLDIGRSYLAGILSSVTECDRAVAWKSILWPNNIYNGDLATILPKLKPGSVTKTLAFDIVKRVRRLIFVCKLNC
jgi:arginyl-tRNA synthetase